MNDSQKQALLSYARRIAELPLDRIERIRRYQESDTPPETWDEIGVMIDEDGWETLTLDIETSEKIVLDERDDE